MIEESTVKSGQKPKSATSEPKAFLSFLKNMGFTNAGINMLQKHLGALR